MLPEIEFKKQPLIGLVFLYFGVVFCVLLTIRQRDPFNNTGY